MKLKITLILTLFFAISVFSQDYTIDATDIMKSSNVIVNKRNYELKIMNFDKIEVFKIEKDFKIAEPLKTDKTLATDGSAFVGTEKTFYLDFDDNTIYTFTLKKASDSEPSIYIFKSVSKWSWTTTFGANGVFLVNTDSYKTIKSVDNTYNIIEYKSEKRIEYIPSLMFTFLNKSKDVSFGFTGGIGFDLEQISVFSGLSLGIGQNIIFTAGVAFNQQAKLNSSFSVGQEVDTALTTENLTSQQYRFNPFVGISFRLDKNPFN
jgi:hypothetical protein